MCVCIYTYLSFDHSILIEQNHIEVEGAHLHGVSVFLSRKLQVREAMCHGTEPTWNVEL